MSDGKSPVVAITGCGRKRVGFHIAKHLMQNGYSIAAIYRSNPQRAENVVRELRDFLPSDPSTQKVELFQCDVSDEDSVQNLVSSVTQTFGKIDGMICTASLWKKIPLEEVTHQDLMNHVSVDLVGTFHCNRQVGLQMVKQATGGCIINFADWADGRPYPDHAAYFAAKGSIPTLSRCMARELGQRNPKVRVHCLLPGPILLPDGAPDSQKELLKKSTLVQQIDRPDAVGMAVEHFLKNDFLTGTCLPVDGGRTVYCPGELE